MIPNPLLSLIVVPRESIVKLIAAAHGSSTFRNLLAHGWLGQAGYCQLPTDLRKSVSGVLSLMKNDWWAADAIWERAIKKAAALEPSALHASHVQLTPNTANAF